MRPKVTERLDAAVTSRGLSILTLGGKQMNGVGC